MVLEVVLGPAAASASSSQGAVAAGKGASQSSLDAAGQADAEDLEGQQVQLCVEGWGIVYWRPHLPPGGALQRRGSRGARGHL